jgi:general L-amino acid transport system substrate-binding protein
MGGRIWQVLAALILTIVWSAPGAAVTLDLVKQRGELNCGVAGGVRGFSDADETGRWQGLNVDICRALAAAVIGSSEKVAYVPLTEKAPLTALMSGRVDLIVMDTPWTLTLDSSLGIRVVGTSYYDGQSFMVQTRLGRKSALELEGASVCVPGGEGLEDHFNEYVKEHDIRVKSIRHETFSQAARVLPMGGATCSPATVRGCMDFVSPWNVPVPIWCCLRSFPESRLARSSGVVTTVGSPSSGGYCML